MVLDHEPQHPSRWAMVVSIAATIGCTAQALNEWVKKAERDSGRRSGPTTEVAAKLKALERENGEASGIARLVEGIAAANKDDGRRLERGAAVLDDLYEVFRTKRRWPA